MVSWILFALKIYTVFMPSCFVALGANVGFAYKNCKEALLLLRRHPEILHLRSSRFYMTKPLYAPPQPSFINGMCRFECILSPYRLFSLLEEIEQKLGKGKKPQNAPRKIDLDLIFYGDLLLRSEKLTLPHPRWKERTFVIKSLGELL